MLLVVRLIGAGTGTSSFRTFDERAARGFVAT
jgi:hypothetical protein